MKTPRYFMLATTLLLALFISGIPVSAQQTDQEKSDAAKKAAMEKAAVQGKLAMEVENKIKTEIFTVLEAKLGFETKFVKGAPYSAVAVSESIQTLGDGNRIRQTTSTTVYRDNAGRIRREVMQKDGTVQAIAISDPATGVNYTLDPKNRTAMKTEFAGVMKTVRDEEALKMKLDAEKKFAAMKTAVAAMPIPVDANASEKKQPVKESLGQQMIEGVNAEGVRITITIPAGQIGNDLPINIVSEQWYSPELQLLVMTKHSDPRTGETTYRLTNINRAEPDHSLFEVPSDYTMRNVAEEKRRTAEEMRVKMTKPEEQQ